MYFPGGKRSKLINSFPENFSTFFENEIKPNYVTISPNSITLANPKSPTFVL